MGQVRNTKLISFWPKISVELKVSKLNCFCEG